MKRLLSSLAVLCLAIIASAVQSPAQYEQDLLRLSFPGLSVGARSLGMGMAYTGVANDFSAVYWNPAGLGQLRMNEVTFGLSHLSYDNTSTFYSEDKPFTNSGTSLNSLGFVYAVPTTRGSFTIALGYGRQADFTTGLSFLGFNPKSSIIQYWAPDGHEYPADLTIAEQLELAFADTSTGRFVSPIHDSLTQSGKILEGGGLNTVSASAAFEVAQDLYLGATLNVITGSYSYRRNYYEDDLNHRWQSFPYDLSSLYLFETVDGDISGVTAKLGFLYKFGPNSRVGIAIKTPAWITVREDVTTEAQSTFDNGDTRPKDGPYRAASHDEWDAATPFVFSAGVSVGVTPTLMLAGDIDFTDWTEMEFRNANPDLLALNTSVKEDFQATANLRVGAEYEAVEGTLQLRGGFAYLPSPYQGDPSSFARKYITAGIGFLAAKSVAVDVGYAYGFWNDYLVNYDYMVNGRQTSRTDEDIHTNNLMATVSYRF